VGVADLSVATIRGSTYPLATALTDCLNPIAVVLVAWLVARSLRSSATAVDRYDADSNAAHLRLAAEWKRVREHRMLSGELLATLGMLADKTAVGDPTLQAHIRSEAAWLRSAMGERRPKCAPKQHDSHRSSRRTGAMHA
jgi:hypothetical protein